MIRPSIMIPWRISQARKSLMAPVIIALESIGVFWQVWGTVYGANK